MQKYIYNSPRTTGEVVSDTSSQNCPHSIGSVQTTLAHVRLGALREPPSTTARDAASAGMLRAVFRRACWVISHDLWPSEKDVYRHPTLARVPHAVAAGWR